ncbi:MAG: glycerophosphodiester phosphodiesterase [Ruminococcaceae bacterium]|nr:glycerophosphodiester phosphodiesterase [Oscillospiraceae bacterium]
MGIYVAAGVIVLISLIYLFLIAPRCKKVKFKLPNVGYAHRGLWNSERPENSMTAFSAAVERGVGIETDVRLTKDGVPVLFHDETLKRMCGDERRVIDCTYQELKELSLGASDEKIPKLSDLLELAGGKVPLLIELKGEDLKTELCSVIAPMLDPYGDMLTVESFNPVLLNKMKKLRPNIARGQLVTALVSQNHPGNILRNGALSCMLLNFLSRPDFIAYDKKFPNGLSIWICTKIFRAKAFVWTVRGEAEINKFKKACPIFEEK